MSLGIFFKQLCSFLLQSTITKRLSAVSPDYVVVLTYHRVLSAGQITDNVEPGMYVTPAALRKHIRFLKKHFDIVAAGQAVTSICGEPTGRIRPCCVLTFDDGWLDFYANAWSVLQEENVPAIVYLPTDLISSGKQFWTDRLAIILAENKFLFTADLFADDIQVIAAADITYEQKLSQIIALLKGYPYHAIDKLLDQCEQAVGIAADARARTFMNWDEIRELSSGGLVSFGSHTVHHAILPTLSEEEIQAELRMSYEVILQKIGQKDSLSFCYPNGGYSTDISQLVRKTGYSSAMTCDFGWNKTGDDPFSLKRISLHQDISSSKYLLAYRLAQGL